MIESMINVFLSFRLLFLHKAASCTHSAITKMSETLNRQTHIIARQSLAVQMRVDAQG
jgi:hypothetical protein